MGSKSPTTQTQESTPWAGQQPFLTDIFQQASNIYYGGGPQAYPGQMVAPFSPQTQLGLDLQTQMALGGDPMMQGVQNWAQQQWNMPQLDPTAIAGYGTGMQQQGAGMMGQAGMGGLDLPAASQYAGGAIAPYTGALQGMTGYGGLGEASQFFGQPAAGALPAAQQFAGGMMQQPGQTIDPAAAGQLGATAGGGYLGGNPYLDQLYETGAGRIQEQFAEQTLPALAAQFGAAGRTGSGAQALATGRAAGDVAQELSGLYGDIYAPAYEAERGRQIQAAGQLGELGLGTGQLGLGAGQLAGDLYGTQAGAELGRLGAAADLYTGERGLAQQAAMQGGQLGLGGAQLGADIWGQGLNRMLSAGQGIGQLGTQGMGGLTDLFGQIGQQGYRAGALQPGISGQRYADIDRLRQVGALTEDQAQRMIDAEMQRWEFMQQQPWSNLGQYMGAIYGLPGGYGTQTQVTPGGSRLSGALGGAMAGGATGNPWMALGGGILGALG